jgi:hypothetical protein
MDGEGGLKNRGLTGRSLLLVTGDEHVVVDLLVEVEVPQGRLVLRLQFDQLLQLLHAQLANRVQVLEYLADDDPFLLGERVGLRESAGEGELDCLREVLPDWVWGEVPCSWRRGRSVGRFIIN